MKDSNMPWVGRGSVYCMGQGGGDKESIKRPFKKTRLRRRAEKLRWMKERIDMHQSVRMRVLGKVV